MKDQPGLSTNLPWLLKDENTLEDETKRVKQAAWQVKPGRCVRIQSHSPDVTPPGNSWEGRVCSAVPGHAVQLQIDNFISYSLYHLTTQIAREVDT